VHAVLLIEAVTVESVLVADKVSCTPTEKDVNEGVRVESNF